MKTRLLSLGWILLCVLPPEGTAATFDLNCVKGLWQFNGDLDPRWTAAQQPLVPAGLVIGGTFGPHYESLSHSGQWLALRSDSVPFGGLKSDEMLQLVNQAGPNGPAGAAYTNNWTIVMDVRIPVSSDRIALVQDSTNLGDSAEIFLNTARQVIFFGANGNPVASDPIPADTWVRLAFTSSYDAGTNHNILKTYVNGTVTTQSAGGALWAARDGFYGLKPVFCLFSDPFGDTAPVEVNSVAFWSRPLAAADISTIGTIAPAGIWDFGGIDWPDMTPPDGYPPIPLLNGSLMFGTLETRFVPDMTALAASATAPLPPGTIAEVEVDPGPDGGTIPGVPSHTVHPFGTTLSAYVLADGTLVSRDYASVLFHPPFGQEAAPDTGVVGGVTFIRATGGVVLVPDSGAWVSFLSVCLPPGFGVALDEYDGLLYATAYLVNARLDSQLAPYQPVTFTREHFDPGQGAGPIYPVLDRVPVRFRCPTLAWTPAEGVFRFDQDAGSTAFHRIPQLTIVAAQQAAGLPGAAIVPPSNDGYFLAAGTPASERLVEVKARPNGAALVNQLTLDLDATALGGDHTAFATHYPVMSVAWEGEDSRIRFAQDAIDTANSRLTSARASLTSYRRAPKTQLDLCAGQGTPVSVSDEDIHFRPTSNEWRFTPDGGLRAAGTVASDPLFFLKFTPQWGGYLDPGLNEKFTHAVTLAGGFTRARVTAGGMAVRADTLPAALPTSQRVAALLLTGFGSPANESLVERPQTTGFGQGLADYPGVNLRGSDAPAPHQATSIIAGVAITPPSYDLSQGDPGAGEPEAKYCIRPGGVNGLHLADGASSNITFSAFGADFQLTRLILSYRDGENVASGVGGALYMPAPADFSLVFSRLRFGAQGQLDTAEIADGMGTLTMGPAAWNLEFEPLSIDFPQPVGCPPPQPGDAFVRIGASAELLGLGNATFTGNLGFKDGNIVTESLPLVNGTPIAQGTGPVSRFAPGNLLQIQGTSATGQQPWNINPVTAIYVNRWDDDLGTLTVGGLMDLPFFVDLPVILSTGSQNQALPAPETYVRAPWDLLDAAVYDPDHVGFPAALVTTVDAYRQQEEFDPVAERNWQDLISFSFPVKMDGDRVLRSRSAVSGQDLMIFNLTEAVRSITPASAELTFDGRNTSVMDQLEKQVNVASLLGDSSGMGSSQAAVDSGLACVRELDELLADHTHPLLDPGLAALAGQGLTDSYFNALHSAPDRSAKLNELASPGSGGLAYEIVQMLGPDPSDPVHGRWRRDTLDHLTTSRTQLLAAGALVQSSSSVTGLAANLAARMGLSNPPGTPDTARMQAITEMIDQTAARLQDIIDALDPTGDLTFALQLALGDANAIAPVVQQAVNDLKPRWAPANQATAEALYNSPGAQAALRQDLAAALADRFAGSAFAASCGKFLRQYAGDPQTLSRQALDDTLRMACQLVADTNTPDAPIPANGVIGDYLTVNRLSGYGRITGDSLHELRLDGQVALSAHPALPSMDFDGWFMVRDIDSSTPGSEGLADAGVKAEIQAGATTVLDWGQQPVNITLGGKVGIGDGGVPLCYMGDIAMVGDLDFNEVTLRNIKLGFGMGADNGYFYGRGAGSIKDMDVTAGLFFGKTTDQPVLENADSDIAAVVTEFPATGGIVYGEGSMSLMPLLGIPPSCLLDLRVGGGQGYFFFENSGDVIGGFKISETARGELLCLVDVSGRYTNMLYGTATLGGDAVFDLTSITGKAWATLEGEVGYDPFSYTFEKSVGISLKIVGDDLIWKADY